MLLTMTQYLPPNLLALFAPREPIPFLPPPDNSKKKTQGYLGVGAFLDLFEDPKDTPPPTRVETREERIERRRRERAEQVAYKLEREIATWDPNQQPTATEDPFKTLFVARINYDTSESKLRREFEIYGAIKKIILIQSKESGKPRGYAFIEYEYERDMHSAYKHADGKKIDGKRVLVDVERARTVKGWLPRRLGGGLGGTRRGGPEVNIKHSGREDNERERERYRMEREREDRRERFETPRFERRRSRSPRDRRRRSRSKDRRRKRDSRERDLDESPGAERKDRWESNDRRERSRSKERRRKRDSRERELDDGGKKRRRSRSRSRERNRDRSEKKRDKRDKDRERKERKPEFRDVEVKIKEEPADEYTDYSVQYSQYPVKNEDGEEEKYRPHEHDGENGSRGANTGSGHRYGAVDHEAGGQYDSRYGGGY